MFSQRTSIYTIRKNFKQFQLHTVLTLNIRASYNVDEEEKKCPICWTHVETPERLGLIQDGVTAHV
jgi:hypothetical protein